jgi:hypothetical protein
MESFDYFAKQIEFHTLPTSADYSFFFHQSAPTEFLIQT